MNTIEFFRFVGGEEVNSNGHEDVFIEDDHYLYAEAEPMNWAYMFYVREYILNGDKYIRGEANSADTQYLDKLQRADVETAKKIIEIERREVEATL